MSRRLEIDNDYYAARRKFDKKEKKAMKELAEAKNASYAEERKELQEWYDKERTAMLKKLNAEFQAERSSRLSQIEEKVVHTEAVSNVGAKVMALSTAQDNKNTKGTKDSAVACADTGTRLESTSLAKSHPPVDSSEGDASSASSVSKKRARRGELTSGSAATLTTDYSSGSMAAPNSEASFATSTQEGQVAQKENMEGDTLVDTTPKTKASGADNKVSRGECFQLTSCLIIHHFNSVTDLSICNREEAFPIRIKCPSIQLGR